MTSFVFVFFFQAEDGIRDYKVTGVQTCALPISWGRGSRHGPAATPASSSWAIARATAPKWLGSNCWVSDRPAGGGEGGAGEARGAQGPPFVLPRLWAGVAFDHGGRRAGRRWGRLPP